MWWIFLHKRPTKKVRKFTSLFSVRAKQWRSAGRHFDWIHFIITSSSMLLLFEMSETTSWDAKWYVSRARKISNSLSRVFSVPRHRDKFDFDSFSTIFNHFYIFILKLVCFCNSWLFRGSGKYQNFDRIKVKFSAANIRCFFHIFQTKIYFFHVYRVSSWKSVAIRSAHDIRDEKKK